MLNRLLKKAHVCLSQHRLGGTLAAGGVSQDRCNRVRVRCTVDTLEPPRLVHRSFDPPPAFRLQERGGLLSKPKASNVNGSKNPLAYCFGRAKQAPERPPLLSGSEVSPRTNLPAEETSGAKGRPLEQHSRRIDFETLFKGMIGSIQTTYLRATQTK